MKDVHCRGPLVSWRALLLLAALALAAGCLQLETHIQLREDGGAIVSERLRFSRVLLDLAGDREAELLRFISREGVLARMQQMGKGVTLVRHEVREADGNSRESLSEFQVADINDFLYAAPWPFYLDYASNAVMRCRLEPMLRNGYSGGQDWAGSIALRFELLKPARGADDGKDPKAPAAAGPNPSELQLARELGPVFCDMLEDFHLKLSCGSYCPLIPYNGSIGFRNASANATSADLINFSSRDLDNWSGRFLENEEIMLDVVRLDLASANIIEHVRNYVGNATLPVYTPNRHGGNAGTCVFVKPSRQLFDRYFAGKELVYAPWARGGQAKGPALFEKIGWSGPARPDGGKAPATPADAAAK